MSLSARAPMRGSVTAPKLRITCPDCSADIGVRVNPDDPDVVVRNCFRCNERIYIDVTKGTVVRSEKRAPLKATYELRDGKALITCPGCMNEIRATYDPSFSSVKASCGRCTNLVEATPVT